MATLEDEYIVKSRKIYHRIGHNIVGNSNGSKDEKEVYRLNVTQKLPGNTIRNKYEPGYMGANGPFWTKHTVETFTPSSEEEFVAQRRRAAGLRQYSRALVPSMADEQKRPQRWREYDTSSGSDTEDSSDDEHSHAHVRQPKLNFEPPDNKDTGNQPSGNQPDVNQPEWCAIA